MRAAAAAALLATLAFATPAAAQLGAAIGGGGGQPISRDQPVYYQADTAQYNRQTGIVTLSGHVEIWQGDRVLRADKVTYDRNSGIAAAIGHVVLLEPNGQVLFADYAELSKNMKDGILSNLRAQLAQNGKLAANGGRRTGGEINELSRVIYSTCNVCRQHPDEPPLWDLRARSAVQDLENKRIEYRDAVLDFYGVPVMYLPYFTHPDPSAKRQSGFLVPSVGVAKYLGAFVTIPYYWAIDGQSDATFTPMIASNNGPAVEGQYRRAFNFGTMTLDGSLARDKGQVGWDTYLKGNFDYNDEWRYGFNIQRASTAQYIRDYHKADFSDVLTSSVFADGFGQGAYARLDARAYQGLVSSVETSALPYVLPRFEYDFLGEPDALGGRFGINTQDFNVIRDQGTNTRRASLSMNWDRPAVGALGDVWKLTLHVDSTAYNATQINEQPTFGNASEANSAQGMPSAALMLRWPLQRSAGDWGTQIIEPIAQVIAAPYGSSYAPIQTGKGPLLDTLIPNEDSLDFQFTDQNLFALNRFSGVDRLEGGPRANLALHAAWWFNDGKQIDGEIGQGYRVKNDPAFPVGSGLNDTSTDIVSRLTFTPSPLLDLTEHTTFNHDTWNVRFSDVVASGGPEWLRMSAGYLYSQYNLYTYYSTTPTGVLTGPPRNEVSLGAATRYSNWRFSGSGRRDIETGKMDSLAGTASYENECFIFSVLATRRFTSVLGDNGATSVLFQITLKTVGTFGFNGR
jgi:LPS-assembly protein